MADAAINADGPVAVRSRAILPRSRRAASVQLDWTFLGFLPQDDIAQQRPGPDSLRVEILELSPY